MSLVYADGDHPRLLMGLHGRVTSRKVAPVEVKPSTEEDLRAASDDPDYVTLYHKTPTRNVESIMKSGLLPRYGKPTQGENPAYNAVYFHTDKKKSAGFSTGEPSTVLKVVLPINGDLAMRLRPDEDTFHKTAADCVKDGAPVAYRGPVPPEYIEPMNKSLEADLMKSKAAEPELSGGEWRTIHGAHVYIKEGKVVAGADGHLGHFSMSYVRIHQDTPNFGKQFAQDIEPHGEYMSHDTSDGKSRIDLPNFEYGKVHFKRPLVMEHEGTGHGGWKTKLSERFGGKKGKALSNAIKKAGYDGIVTMEDGKHILEVVNLAGEKTKHGEADPEWTQQKQVEKALTGGTPVQPLLIINLEKSVSAPPKKWYQDILDAGGHWVTIKKEGPLKGRHILINGSGHIEAGKGIPPHILDKIRGGHIDNHKPYDKHGPEFDPGDVPEPPKDAPKPEPPKEAPKGKGGAKTGYGADATMYVSGPRTFNHLKNLKHMHGGKWNGDESRWEYNHAPGSEGHQKLEEYVNKYQGLELHHITKDGASPAPAPAPKEEPKEEPQDTSRDISKESFEDMMKNPPTADQMFDHLMKKYAKYNQGKPDTTHQAWIRQDAEEYARSMKRLADSPELHSYAKKYLEDMGALNTEFPMYADNAYTYAKNHYDEEQENKRRREELEKSKGKYKSISFDSIKDLVNKSPTVDDLKSHFIASQNEARIDRGRSALTDEDINNMMPGIQAHAAEALNAIEEMKKNPELIPHMQDYLAKKEAGTWGKFDPLEHLDSALTAAQEKLAKVHYKTADGKEISFNPNKPRWGHVKGSRNSDYYHSIDVGGRARYVPIPNNKEITKEHVAKWLEGAGDEVHSYVHHVLSGNKGPFTYQKKERVKPSGKYEPFEAPPAKNVKGYLDEAKNDMEGHGARAVVFNSTGTAEERAKTAHAIASGMRALSHILGENMPEVELVIGGTKGSTLAHYRSAYRSITIDPKKGRNSFVHEFGHFLDDAMHGFRGFRHHTTTWGTYDDNSHLKELGEFLRGTDAAKNKDEEIKKYGRQFQTYYKDDTERFARFFAQWLPHEAKKRGMNIPEEIYNPYEIKNNYGEAYTADDLEKGGQILQEVLKKRGLWKGFLQFLSILAGEPTLYVNL